MAACEGVPGIVVVVGSSNTDFVVGYRMSPQPGMPLRAEMDAR